MIRLVLFLCGFIFLVVGFTNFVLYLNLLTMGYTFLDFLKFIVLGYPGLFIVLGFIFITVTIFKEKGKDDEYSL